MIREDGEIGRATLNHIMIKKLCCIYTGFLLPEEIRRGLNAFNTLYLARLLLLLYKWKVALGKGSIIYLRHVKVLIES